jgi:Fe-S cluster biogenesis protein NfuA
MEQDKEKEVKEALAGIRPMLQSDGGDVELVDIDVREGVVKVRFRGACRGCPLAQITLEQGIARAIKDKAKWVKTVLAEES